MRDWRLECTPRLAIPKATCVVDADGFLFIAAAFAPLQSLRYNADSKIVRNSLVPIIVPLQKGQSVGFKGSSGE
jgi:hypothetical protein